MKPEPGIHHVSFDEYLSWVAINSGVVKQPTVRHMQAAMNGELEDKDTTARRFGRGAHCMILEPDEYAHRFLIATPCTGVKRDGEVCNKTAKFYDGIKWYCGTHKTEDAETPIDYVTEEEYEAHKQMRLALKNHPIMDRFRR